MVSTHKKCLPQIHTQKRERNPNNTNDSQQITKEKDRRPRDPALQVDSLPSEPPGKPYNGGHMSL